MDDYYIKIKIQKMYLRYNQVMLDNSINKELIYKLYKNTLSILHYVAENHNRIMSCEMEWVRQEDTGLIFLTDIRNIVMAKQNNKAFTNSLYRHMKRNMVAILDEEGKEQLDNRLQDIEE
jgi:hypothetical protein